MINYILINLKDEKLSSCDRFVRHLPVMHVFPGCYRLLSKTGSAQGDAPHIQHPPASVVNNLIECYKITFLFK